MTPSPPEVTPEVAALIAEMGLAPIPEEGGWFKLGPRLPGLSSIIALLADTADGFSALHRLTIDEGWQWLDGDPIELVVLEPDGAAQVHRLDEANSQVVIAAGAWQGGRTLGAWSTFACWCSPQFIEGCFELGDRAALLADFPAAADEIVRLTRVP